MCHSAGRLRQRGALMSRKTIPILLTALLAASLLPLGSCGVLSRKDKKENASSSNSGLGDATGESAAPSPTGAGDEGGAQTFDINKTVYHSGLKLTFGKMIYDPAKEYPE